MTENMWRPWCPLFVKNPILLNDQTKIPRRIQQCLDVHKEVRKIWEVAQFDLAGSRYPRPDDLPNYPVWKTDSVRVLWESIYFDFDVLFSQKFTSKSEFESGLKNIICRVRILTSVDERITDCEIIALLAMSAAWNALFKMAYGKLPEDHQEVLIMAQTAYALLPHAKKTAQKQEEVQSKYNSDKQVVNNIFRWNSGTWEITYDGKTIRPPDRRGFWYIRYLLKHTGEKIHVSILRQKASNPGERKELLIKKSENIEIEDVHESNSEDTGIDAEAVESYKKRLEELTIEIREAEKDGNELELSELQAEYNKIVACLKSAFDKKKRLRKLSSREEKDRSAVKNCINDALTIIEKQNSALSEHLNTCIKKGSHCLYPFIKGPAWITE